MRLQEVSTVVGDVAQLGHIVLAVALCGVVGLEREWRQKSAGLRTHVLVGVGAALFMVVSKYGFYDVVGPGVTLDPSRVAAQIVSGVGFIGAGLIFVRRESVRGLTTAASIWLAASIGTAAGAGMVVVATGVTLMYLVIAFLAPWLVRAVVRRHDLQQVLRVAYVDGQGLLRSIITGCTSEGFTVTDFDLVREPFSGRDGHRLVDVRLELHGPERMETLVDQLTSLEGIREVSLAEAEDT